MRFTYIGPNDAVDIVVRVQRGDSIDVPESAAGRPAHTEYDDDGNLVSRDLGEGLLAQPELWQADEQALESMTIAQLRDHAEATGVDLTGLTKKADIVAAIERES